MRSGVLTPNQRRDLTCRHASISLFASLKSLNQWASRHSARKVPLKDSTTGEREVWLTTEQGQGVGSGEGIATTCFASRDKNQETWTKECFRLGTNRRFTALHSVLRFYSLSRVSFSAVAIGGSRPPRQLYVVVFSNPQMSLKEVGRVGRGFGSFRDRFLPA